MSFYRKLLWMVLVFLLCPLKSFSDVHSNTFSLGSKLDFMSFDEERQFDDVSVLSLLMNFQLTKEMLIEFNYGQATEDVESSVGSLDYSYYNIGLEFNLIHDAPIKPYFQVGLGTHDISSDIGVESEERYLNLGLGAKSTFFRDLVFFAEISQNQNLSSNQGGKYKDTLMSLGVTYPVFIFQRNPQ